MTGEELLRSIGNIEDGDIELAEGTRSVRSGLTKWIAAAAACLALGLGVFAAVHFAKDPAYHTAYEPTPAPTSVPAETAPAAPTSVPTEEPAETPQATYAPQTTNEPHVQPTDNAMHFTSELGDLLSVTNAALDGGSPEDTPLTPGGSGVYFGFEEGSLVAYAHADIIDEPGSVRYELSDPVEYYPAELGERARKSVADHIRRNLEPGFAGDEYIQLFGFIGEDFIIFTGEPFHGYEACAIFRFDGGEWREFGANEGCAGQITGGCIVSENTGWLCYFDRSLMRFEDYTPRMLTVCRTDDGGRTWRDIGLVIPEELEGVIAPPTAALSPRFEGAHGVLPVTYSSYNGDTDSFESHIALFETTDGGETWEFRFIPWQGGGA